MVIRAFLPRFDDRLVQKSLRNFLLLKLFFDDFNSTHIEHKGTHFLYLVQKNKQKTLRSLFLVEKNVSLQKEQSDTTMLFQKNIIKKYLGLLNEELTQEAWNKYQAYFLNKEIQQNIRQSKEEQFQEGFLRELFVKVLGV